MVGMDRKVGDRVGEAEIKKEHKTESQQEGKKRHLPQSWTM